MNDSMKCVVVLTAICLVISLALAGTNFLTAPIIAAADAKAAQEACFEVMPQGGAFEEVELSDAIPSAITNIYRETSGGGYVFKLVTSGYDVGLTLICGIDAQGLLTGTKTLSSNETKTIGGKTEDASYTDQYIGKDANLEGVQAISGATMTSNGYAAGIREAFAAYEIIAQQEADK